MMNKEFRVGLFMVISILLLYFGFQYLKGKNFFSSVKNYYVVYDNVNKLATSNPVYVNGYAVGRVSDIDMVQAAHETKVLVELEIKSHVILGDSTKAILSSDFLGGKSVQLMIGKITRVMQNKDTLIAATEKGMMDKFSENAQPVAANLQTTLQKLSKVLDNLANNTDQLQSILRKMDKTPDIINATLLNANSKITDVAAQIKDVSDGLNKSLYALAPVLKNVHTITDSMKQMQLNGTIQKVQVSLTKLNATLGQMQKGDNTMGKLFTEDKLYNNLNTLLLRLDTLTNNFNNHPKQFLAPFGKKNKKIKKERTQAKK